MDISNQKNEDKSLSIVINEIPLSIRTELKTSPDTVLIWAASIGSLFLMKIAIKYGATTSEIALYSAANGGHLDCMKLLNRWGVTGRNNAKYIFIDAAGGGHIDCMIYLKRYGVTDFTGAFIAAAWHGRIKCLELLQKWGATPEGSVLPLITITDFNEALEAAAYMNHIDCLKFIKNCGATDFSRALRKVTVYKRILPPKSRKLKEAKEYRDVELLLKTWINEPSNKPVLNNSRVI